MSEREFSPFFEFLKQSPPPREGRAAPALSARPRYDCMACELAVALSAFVFPQAVCPFCT